MKQRPNPWSSRGESMGEGRNSRRGRIHGRKRGFEEGANP
jgi:hypothetical protein